MNREEREQLLAEVQAIPDGTIVAVYASNSLVEIKGKHPFTTTGEIYSIKGPNGPQRYVGDTLISWSDHLSSRVEFVKPVVQVAA